MRRGLISLALAVTIAAALGLGHGGSRIAFSSVAFAAEPIQFTAELDRPEIAEDESVSLKLSLQVEGGVSSRQAPEFQAPDFDIVNEYSSSYLQSFYENGKFGSRTILQLTKVLRPKRTGALKISGIKMIVDGKTYAAPDLEVQVGAGGVATQPPRGYGGGGVGLRGAGKRERGVSYFIRAEIDRQKPYKGEEMIVSYYLYTKVRVFNLNVEKYPALSGFLREDLEMPILGARQDTETVMLDGVPYSRALLVRYAAYPLKEGKLIIDPMAVKLNYYGRQQMNPDDDDPFMNFFQQMSPRLGNAQSDPIVVEVQPLPTNGRPKDFSEAVGEFNLSSAVDRYDVRANEAVTLTLKIEGHGNLANVEQPKAGWPAGLDLYDSKGTTKNGKGGIGQKIFEYVLIPRNPGKLIVPALEFNFFNPKSGHYEVKRTEPFEVNVSPGDPNAANQPVTRLQPQAIPVEKPKTPAQNELRPLKDAPDSSFQLRGHPAWRWLYWLTLAGVLVFVGIVLRDWLSRKREAKSRLRAAASGKDKSWKQIRERISEAGSVEQLPWQEAVELYELLTGGVYDALDRVYRVGARSLSRRDLEQVLVHERKLPENLWRRIDRLLDYAETVRFASAAGAVTQDAAKKELVGWLNDAQLIDDELQDLN